VAVIDAFAGAHSVGLHFQHQHGQQQQQRPAPYSLAAYAAIEAQQPVAEKYRAPAADSLGLTPEHYLSLHAKVEDPAVQEQLLDLMHRELRTGSLHGVVVFGGPPCQKFSKANRQSEQLKAALQTAQDALLAAESELQPLLQSQAAGGSVSAAALAEAQNRVAAAGRVCEAAAHAVVQHELDVQAAEAVVSSFLRLFWGIKQMCMAAGNVPCHLVMENPCSTAEKALWNR
jgi:hypothetical protein